MEDQIAWDYLLAFITLAALAVGLISMAVGKIADWRESREEIAPRRRRRQMAARRARPALPMRVMSRPIVRIEARTARTSEPQRSSAIPLLNGLEPPANGSENRPELALNASEVIAVARMIEHNKSAAKPSKSSTIQAGFGVSRGGSDAYKRASAIYDALFGSPAPAVQYRELTPEQEAMRQQLRLKQKGALN